MIIMGVSLFGLMGLYFRRINQRRDAGKYDHSVADMTHDDILELGEHNPDYRYTY